ncbi:glutamyl-tRNA reductase [Neptunicella marina]|uniref:Glutamyl-tRNA reductase n=1 Tax=Neptunicella marina TaxID=2125989 RepID=A0A8J6LV62_9ALTE|nr:glutamyl-tRNA reductase [Neptunicella marina]MBC3764364.1 glutamyl-tRNA reductase [Neptunicella marina]
MSLFVFGINHKTAAVDIREKVAFSTEQLLEAYHSLQHQTGCQEAVILSTCNRTEVYCYSDNDSDYLTQWMADYHQLEAAQLRDVSYLYRDEQAVKHVMRVASGLDSMVLGEPQILGQLKQAYSSAKNNGIVGSFFEKLIQQSFSAAKKVRTDTDIGANSVSVAYSAVQLAKHIFGSLNQTKVLLIGAGETIELVGRHLHEQGVEKMTVANRTLSRAKEVAGLFNAEVITLAQVPSLLCDADIIISSTASQLPILGKGVVERALKDRRHKPMFLVDLAVPRDIEPEVGDLNDAYLYSVDDLQQIIEQNIANRQEAAQQAEKIIELQVEQFLQWNRSLDSIDVVREYRQQSEQIKQKLQERALNQLADGQPPEQIILELANKLTNSLIHAPTKAIKQSAEKADYQGVDRIRRILGLDTD